MKRMFGRGAISCLPDGIVITLARTAVADKRRNLPFAAGLRYALRRDLLPHARCEIASGHRRRGGGRAADAATLRFGGGGGRRAADAEPLRSARGRRRQGRNRSPDPD